MGTTVLRGARGLKDLPPPQLFECHASAPDVVSLPFHSGLGSWRDTGLLSHSVTLKGQGSREGKSVHLQGPIFQGPQSPVSPTTSAGWSLGRELVDIQPQRALVCLPDPQCPCKAGQTQPTYCALAPPKPQQSHLPGTAGGRAGIAQDDFQ